MTFRYDDVVAWGRSYQEYRRMFALGTADLKRRILGCGDGPSSFNAELTGRGGRVTSVDPLYRMTASALERRIEETRDQVIPQTRREQHRFVWDDIGSVGELERLRMSAMGAFLSDFEPGRREGRYVAAGLPDLPFRDREFDLALCAHLLFFYAEQLSLEFHRSGVLELCRVAREVRIFPLVDVNGAPAPHLEPILHELASAGFEAEIRRVPYEFQRGGNQMMRVQIRQAGSPTQERISASPRR